MNLKPNNGGITMRNNLFTAAIALAIALTLYGCPSSGSDGGTSSPSVGGDGSSSSSKPGSSSSVSSSVPSSSSAVSSSSSVVVVPSSSSVVHSKGNDIANYRTVQIGEQVWMAENLDYDVSGSKCYNNDPANCEIYGRLYDWATAMVLPNCGYGTSCDSQIGEKHRGICPSGWHIPSFAEWTTLGTVDSHAGTKLKATSGWDYYQGKSGNGTDDYGFAALPGGNGYSGGGFGYVGKYGYWWSATEDAAKYASRMAMYYDEDEVYYTVGGNGKDLLYSVRCVED